MSVAGTVAEAEGSVVGVTEGDLKVSEVVVERGRGGAFQS